MKRKMNQNRIYYEFTGYFFLAVLFIFFPFILRGNGLISLTDGYNQAYPVFVYSKQFWKSILNGNVKLFDPCVGLGEDVISYLSVHGFFNPIQIILGTIFPKKMSELAYALSVIGQLYAAGITFLIYIQRYIKRRQLCIAGAILYTLNIYSFFNGIYFPSHLFPMVTLPLLLKGVDDICKKEKKYSICMIGALAIQGMNGYYFLYMEVIITIIYFTIKEMILVKERNIKEIISLSGAMIPNGLIGIGLSSVVFVPSVYGLFSCSRAESNQMGYSLLPNGEQLQNYLQVLLVPDVYNMAITIPVIVFAGCIGILFTKNVDIQKKEFKYYVIIFSMLFISPLWGSIMNGFSYSSDRWFFGVYFILVASAMIYFDSNEVLGTKVNIIIGSALVGLLAWGIFKEFNKTKVISGIILAIGSIMLMIVLNTSQSRENKIMYFSVGSVMILGFLTFGPKVLGGCGYSANFCANGVYDEICDGIKDINIEHENEQFQREDIYDSSINASLIGNYYGTSEYFSMVNKYIPEFYEELVISPGIRDALHILRGLDGRQEILSLLSVAQYMDFETNNNDERTSTIKENEYYLPLGFTYDSYVEQETFEQLSPMEKNSELVDSVVLENPEENKPTDVIKNQYKNEAISFQSVKKSNNKTRIYVSFEKYLQAFEQRQGEVYIRIERLHGNADVYVGNKETRIKDAAYLYYTGIEEYWFNLTEIKQDTGGYYFDINIDGETDFDATKLSIYWHPINYTGVSERQKHVMKDVQIDNNTITGTINCSNDEYLFLSVPFSSGWTAYVDGEKTDVLRANIGFMAISLKSGEHNIELKYVTPGIRVGSFCSIISLAAIAIIYILNKKKGINILK